MYRRILLASDASREGLAALREGALLASSCGARAHLLIVERETPGSRVADGVYPRPQSRELEDLLRLGLARLMQLGVPAAGSIHAGEPGPLIATKAAHFRADLVVVGHRKQCLVQRWWAGAAGYYLPDHVTCSVLVARNAISDQEFESRLAEAPARTAHGAPHTQSSCPSRA
jgi:nucleotide-binding universal stress UspA family protein